MEHNKETTHFLEELSGLMNNYEKGSIAGNEDIYYRLLNRYRNRKLKYSWEESLIMASLIIQRGPLKKNEYHMIHYKPEEYVELFSFLFEGEEYFCEELRGELILRTEDFLREVSK